MIKVLVRKSILKIKDVNWGEIPSKQTARLLWGENPFTPTEAVNAIKSEAKKVNLYPSPTKINLRKELAKYNSVSPENIILTNGSDEAIELVSKVFICENDEVIIPIPTFPVYESASLMMGAKIVYINLEKDFSLDENKLLKAVTKKTKIIWIANPNNPTGNILLTIGQIENLAKKLNCLLVIDECYFELSQVSASQLVNKYPNIIILRSFSKVFALAGARLGYIIANQKVATYLNRLQSANQPFNVNRFAQVAAIAILQTPLRIQQLISDYKSLKENFERLLKEIPLNAIPTKTTFCIIELPKSLTAKQLKERLEKRGIFIKDCYMYADLGKQYAYLGVPPIKYQIRSIKAITTALKELSC